MSSPRVDRPSRPSPEQPLYLHSPRLAMFAMQHAPLASASGIGVLVCPPFGFEHIGAYRSLRVWAQRAAAQGHVALRFDLPGTGDSAGGPRDAGLFGLWVEGIAVAAEHLRAGGAQRIAAIGIGLGGLLAQQAIAAGTSIDDLVLWGTPARGRAVLRELKAFAQLSEAASAPFEFPPEVVPPLPEGALEAGGYLMSAETVEAIRGIDVAAGDFGPVAPRRILLLGRDEAPPEPRLITAAEASGADVRTMAAAGYGAMLNSPHLSRVPYATIEHVVEWISAASIDRPAPINGPRKATSAPGTTDTLELPTVRETPIRIDVGGAELFAVLAEPVDRAPGAPTALLLNSGADRRIGPNRIWVEVARRWAGLGVPVVRIDQLGMGDSDGPDDLADMPPGWLYSGAFGDQLAAALDQLAQTAGLGPRFVVSGVCSGAFWTFQLTVRDPRVMLALPINGRLLEYDAALLNDEADLGYDSVMARAGSLAARLNRSTLSGPLWVLRRQLRRPLLDAIVRWTWGLFTRGDKLDRHFDLLRDRGQSLVMRWTPGEALKRELEREGRADRGARRWPNIRFVGVDGPPGAHTLEVVQLQALIHRELDASLATVWPRAGQGAHT